MESVLLDVAGHRRSPATMPGYHRGRPPRNKGEQYPADPPTVEEIVAVMRAVGDPRRSPAPRAHRAAVASRATDQRGALAPETDLDRTRGAVLVRRGKGGKRREVGMDRWAWDQLDHGWRSAASFRSAPAVRRPRATAGRPWSSSAARKQLHRAA